MEKFKTKALWKQEIQATLKLGLPMALTQLGVIALNTIDLMFIGRLGPEALAASALGHSLWVALFLFSVGVLTAVPALASRAIGAHKPRTVRRIARQGIWISIGLGVPISGLLSFGEPILLGFNQTVENAEGAMAYLSTLLWGVVPALIFISLRGYIASYAIVRPVLIITFFAIPLNIILDYALIFGHFGFPRLELWGAGLATSIVHVCSCIALVLYLIYSRKFRRKAVFARLWRPDWQHFFEILKLGFPIGCLLLLETGLFSAMALLMGQLGTIELAAHQVTLQVASITFMVPLGISQAATIRVGHAIGRKEHVSVRRAAYSSLALGALLMGCFALPMIFWPEGIVSLFLSPDHVDTALVVMLGTTYLFIAALFQVSDGIQVISGGILRGLKDTKVPMYYGIFGYWIIGFTGGYYLAFEAGFSGVGIWLGLLIGLSCTAVLNVLRLYKLIHGSKT